ncbi:hypothetical protein JBE27_06450 [Streptomyces albiflaviniger]|nr:hypothetical protein [Streptomyces albiflaviniger]
MFVAQVVIVVLLVAAGALALVLFARQYSMREARQQSVTAAEAFANSPGVVAALDSRNPTAVLQPRAEAARQRGGPPLPGGSGPAIEAIVPVFRDNGSVSGLVTAGVKIQNVTRLAQQQLPIVFGSGAGALTGRRPHRTGTDRGGGATVRRRRRRGSSGRGGTGG